MTNILKTYKSSIILLISIFIGGIFGFFLGPKANMLQPIADIFLHLLYCCVVPLIFCSLSSAIAKMQDTKKLKKILGLFLVGSIISNIISSLFMLIPVLFFSPTTTTAFKLGDKVNVANSNFNILSMFTVDDFFKLFSRNNLMALIVFTVIFAFALIRVGDKAKNIIQGLDHLTSVIVQMIAVVMKMAPLGLGCYFAILIGTNSGDVIAPLSKALMMYTIIVIIYFIFSQTIYAYIGAGLVGVKRWWQTATQPTLTALGTCSSAASLAANIEHARQLGIPSEIANLVLPLGANLHKDGSCITQILKIAFLSSMFNLNLASLSNILIAIAVSLIISVVVGGIPGGGYVGEIFIISAFGFPEISIPIMVLIGTVTDALATALNVTGDTGLAMVISRYVEGKHWFKTSS